MEKHQLDQVLDALKVIEAHLKKLSQDNDTMMRIMLDRIQ